jgi:hypothetical protein
MTDDLLDRLSADLKPQSPSTVIRRLAAAASVGAGVALVGVVLGWGLRPDMPQALSTSMFWMKLAYALALGGVAVWAVERLSRPGGSAGRLRWAFSPVLLIAAAAGVRLMGAPAPLREPLLMGASAAVCPWRILLTAVPVFAGLVWALRGLAPTRLRLTGAAAGLAAGGIGAAVYALHCPEAAAPFVAVWYTLGVGLAALGGALLGPRLLRW